MNYTQKYMVRIFQGEIQYEKTRFGWTSPNSLLAFIFVNLYFFPLASSHISRLLVPLAGEDIVCECIDEAPALWPKAVILFLSP